MEQQKTPHWRTRPFQPPSDVYRSADLDEPFLPYSTCTASDFMHPEFPNVCQALGAEEAYHRKLWEWVYIYHKLRTWAEVRPGKRGLVFAVGCEPLPAAFAVLGASITATDAPREIGEQSGWRTGNQFSDEFAALNRAGLISEDEFQRLVEFRHCDMNNIDPDLKDYDFCWSACSLEHLGTLQKGIDFVINTVEKVLKIGGVAVHTTEFNCSSNRATIETGGTVLYRRRDMDGLVNALRERGHEVDLIRVAPDRYAIDTYVDVPPYWQNGAHLKLEIGEFVVTSIGVTVRRGR
jgi:hypothetical protein